MIPFNPTLLVCIVLGYLVVYLAVWLGVMMIVNTILSFMIVQCFISIGVLIFTILE